MNKNLVLVIVLVMFALQIKGQNIGINSTGAVPNASAMLDIDVSALATKTGLLIPRITNGQRTAMNPLPAAAQGLLVYQTDGVQGFYYNTSISTTPAWSYLTAGGWALAGNAGTIAGNNFLGTTDSIAMVFKINSHIGGRIGLLAASDFNTSFGNNALLKLTTGANTSAFGAQALLNTTTGGNNTAIGVTSGTTNTTGSNNTYVGYNANPSTAALSNATAIGANAVVSASNAIVLGGTGANASNVGIGNATPDPSAKLDITSTTTGLLIPRVALTSTNAAAPVAAPLTSLLVYNTATAGINPNNVLPGFYFWNGAKWVSMAGVQPTNWLLTGNAGTVAGTNFLGTTDSIALVFKVNNHMGARVGLLSDLNTNFGNYSLSSAALTGNSNTAFGTKALYKNTSGSSNTATGAGSLQNNTTGGSNVANGNSAMFANTTGVDNVAIGTSALFSNTSGGYNVANGQSTLFSNSSGNNNVGIGYSSLFSNSSGYSNTAIGTSTLYLNTTGSRNAAIGDSAMYSNTTGNYNMAAGYSSLFTNSTGYNNTAIGNYSMKLNTSGNRNSALGDSALFSNTTGNANSAFGTNALSKNTTGTLNTAMGINAMTNNSTGLYNTGVGSISLFTNTTGSFNTGIGYGTLYTNSSASYSTGVGYNALYNNNGTGNAGFGYFALENNTGGTYNTALGTSTLVANTSGQQNTATGYEALLATTIGNYNTALGALTLSDNTSGTNNVAIGYSAGFSAAHINTNTTGSYNVFIGSNAGQGTASQLTNAIAIGKNATVNISNACVIGGPGADNVFVGIGTSSPAAELDVCGSARITGTLNVGGAVSSSTGIACSSDRRYKKNILPLNNALENVLKLQGVSYNWRADEFPEKKFNNELQIGFIAQDIEKIFPQMVFTDDKGYKSVDYSRLTPVLVEALKQQQKIIDAQNKNIEDLKAEVKDIQALLQYHGLAKPTTTTTSVSAEKK